MTLARGRFRELVTVRPYLLDGATGTELMKRGLPAGAMPERWVMDNPEAIRALHREYFACGSDIVLACTFGCNRVKLADYGLEKEVGRMNGRLVEISRSVVPEGRFLFGDVSPTGKLVEPSGEFPFEEAVDVFREQARALWEAGVDGFMIETMLDVQEARAALMAVREVAPEAAVLCGLTYDGTGRTMGGTPPEAAVAILQGLGADAVGCNCSTGPEEMLPLLARMLPQARVPLFIKPNAGMPQLRGGRNVYEQAAAPFSEAVRRGVAMGARLVGGCCGTTPEHIRAVRAILDRELPEGWRPPAGRLAVASSRRLVDFSPVESRPAPLRVIGERINPTGKKAFQAELLAGDLDRTAVFAQEQSDAGADMLDVNLGLGGVDEAALLRRAVAMLSLTSELPLAVDTVDPVAMEAALRVYPGRALVNSVSGERGRLERILPLAARYGAAIIVLPVTDGRVPGTAEERMEVVRRVMAEARRWGFGANDVLVDGLAMTVSADALAGREALATLSMCRDEGLPTVLGLSNVSFGMPERKWLNANFLAMAMAGGLAAVIANPSAELLMEAKASGDALLGRDGGAVAYIERFAAEKTNEKTDGRANENDDDGAGAAGERGGPGKAVAGASPAKGPLVERSPGELAAEAVLRGGVNRAARVSREALSSGVTAGELVSGFLVPAIMRAGERFERGEYFLPQLMLSGEAMRLALAEIEPDLSRERRSSGSVAARGRVVMATVSGDVHDIGKNLVVLMLRNHGFEVEDLGKDVPAEAVVEAVRSVEPDVLGLSALMTTTLSSMRETILAVRESGSPVKVMVGGAAVTEHFAREAGADCYGEDAVAAVKLVQGIVGTASK